MPQEYRRVLRLLGITDATVLRSNDYSIPVFKTGAGVVKVAGTRSSAGRPSSVIRELQALFLCLGIAAVPTPVRVVRREPFEALVLNELEGRPLDEIDRSDVPLVPLVRRLARILLALSMRGVAHNDLLPRNVIWRPDGAVHLVDFDQATAHGRTIALLRNFLGTAPATRPPVYGSLLIFTAQELALRMLPARLFERLHMLARGTLFRLPADLDGEASTAASAAAPAHPTAPSRPVPSGAPAPRGRRRGLATPVLLLTYNRPELTVEVLEGIRRVRPQTLFVAADGPTGHPTDALRCGANRDLLRLVDWPCDVHTLFQPTNLGCKAGPEAGISWFFEHVDAGIILEDDCVPSDSFFRYCHELLDAYHLEERIMMIAGSNRLGTWKADEQSYHLCRTASVWGWATWGRAWQRHDPAMTQWATPTARRSVAELLGPREFRLRRGQFDRVYYGGFDAWDWPWAFSRILHDGLAAVPARNLVANIGFGRRATHTKRQRRGRLPQETQELSFPLVPPTRPGPDVDYDAAVCRQSDHALQRARRTVRRMAPARPVTGRR